MTREAHPNTRPSRVSLMQVTDAMTRPSFEDAARHLDALHATGFYPALQLCVRHHGQIVLHRTLGRYRPIGQDTWRDADDQTRFMIFSLSKSVTACCLHILFERGVLHIDDPVCWHLPAFTGHGKQHITLRHLLTHTAGIPMLNWRIDDALIRDWDRVIQQLCDARLIRFPGRWTGYHLLSSGYILAEVLQRVDGRSLRTFLREELREPMGLETFDYGTTPDRYAQTASSELVEPQPPAPIIDAISRLIDLDLPQTLAMMNRPAVFDAVIPSGNIVATAEEVSRFFQLLLDGGAWRGRRILSQRQITRATQEQVLTRHDLTLFLTPQRYSQGFMLGRKHTGFNVFGRNTEQAFGHLGFTRNLGWADPARQLAIGLLTSGKPTYPRHETLILRQLQDAIYAAADG
jgi:CubicO group peptidase (beta-lactamase class C family)